LWIYGAASGHETIHFWKQALPVGVSLALAPVFLVLCYAALRALGKERRFGLEACMRWLCD
jgi:hypothetical protein